MNRPSEPIDSSLDPSELAARNVGRVLGQKWRLERVLGAGGMATVYAATHRNNLRTVAVKMLHPQLAGDAEIRKRFLREGYIANKVNHPGAVNVLDEGVEEDGAAYLIMELLVGESLHDRQRRSVGALEADEVLRIADKILDVLAAAHEQGIVHRDLKPDNVFLTEDGVVKVLDFGIARLVDPGERATRTGVMIGTPSYMPPEQARGRSNQVDQRSDLWAVGAIMFALLSGHHVHEAETQNEVLLRAMTSPAPKLATVLPEVDPKVAEVVDRALAFEPDDRYPDARTMQEAVREVLALVETDGPSMALRGTVPALAPLTPPSGVARRAGASGSAFASGRSLAGSMTNTPMPIVEAAPLSRGRSGFRLAVLGIFLALLAAGGGVLARYVNDGRKAANTGAADASTSGPEESDASFPSLPNLGALGAMFETPDAAPDLDAASDADADDEEEEDDDGGDDDEEVTDAAVRPGPQLATPTRSGAHPVKKVVPTKTHKKVRRVKKRR